MTAKANAARARLLNSQVLLRFAEPIENGKMPIVPNIMIGGEGGKGAGGLVEMMLAMLVADKASVPRQPETSRPTQPD